jgi:hypothetical protein
MSLKTWTQLVTVVTKIYTSPIWVHALYAHGQIFIPIVQCVTVPSVIIDCPKEMSLM